MAKHQIVCSCCATLRPVYMFHGVTFWTAVNKEWQWVKNYYSWNHSFGSGVVVLVFEWGDRNILKLLNGKTCCFMASWFSYVQILAYDEVWPLIMFLKCDYLNWPHTERERIKHFLFRLQISNYSRIMQMYENVMWLNPLSTKRAPNYISLNEGCRPLEVRSSDREPETMCVNVVTLCPDRLTAPICGRRRHI